MSCSILLSTTVDQDHWIIRLEARPRGKSVSMLVQIRQYQAKRMQESWDIKTVRWTEPMLKCLFSKIRYWTFWDLLAPCNLILTGKTYHRMLPGNNNPGPLKWYLKDSDYSSQKFSNWTSILQQSIHWMQHSFAVTHHSSSSSYLPTSRPKRQSWKYPFRKGNCCNNRT